MPGSRITDRQVHLYMSYRKHHPRKVAAAKAGMSPRTARRIEGHGALPSQQPRRCWRSGPDPFAEVWASEMVPLLQSAPRSRYSAKHSERSFSAQALIGFGIRPPGENADRLDVAGA